MDRNQLKRAVDKAVSDGEYEAFEAALHEVAREEIASMAGLTMNRLQALVVDKGIEGNIAMFTIRDLQGIFGEILRDFGATESEPG